MTVPNTGDTAPPTGLSKHIAAVMLAREAVDRADEHGSVTLDVDFTRDLLEAYDSLAARFSVLATSEPTATMPHYVRHDVEWQGLEAVSWSVRKCECTRPWRHGTDYLGRSGL